MNSRLFAVACAAVLWTACAPDAGEAPAGETTTMPYSAEQLEEGGIPVVRLRDEAADVTVSILPKTGNIAYEMLVNGKNAFWFPAESPAAFAADPGLAGNPLLWPWANRLDQDGFYFEGKFHALDLAAGGFGRDGAKQPIHGLLKFSDLWEVTDLDADGNGAAVTSRLSYSEHEALAAQFPFPHVIEMTYRLAGGELTVETRIQNTGEGAMPVSLGYHPYFQLHDSPRDDWRVHVAADAVWELGPTLVPTGETKPIGEVIPRADNLKLQDVSLDHVFGRLQRNAEGEAVFSVTGAAEKIEVVYGPGYDTAVVYAPPGDRAFICFEPMVGVTNVFNLAHAGKYDALQTIPAGAEKTYRFRVRTSGF